MNWIEGRGSIAELKYIAIEKSRMKQRRRLKD